jgi:hypothetical protein
MGTRGDGDTGKDGTWNKKRDGGRTTQSHAPCTMPELQYQYLDKI